MSDHTPTEDHLRNLYVAIIGGSAHTPSPYAEAEFDRAIAKIKADAWQEGWDAGAGWPQDDTNPHKAES